MAEDIREQIARAWDPVGWAWYDAADTDHAAKPIFYRDAMKRADAVLLVMAIRKTSARETAERIVREWCHDYDPTSAMARIALIGRIEDKL